MPKPVLEMKITVFGADETKKALFETLVQNRIKVQQLVRYYAFIALALAKRRCPVDTGRLRGSISVLFEDAGFTAFIFSNLPYAPPQEFNEHFKHKHGEYGFFRKALADIKEPFILSVRKAMEA